ncbi:PE family protein, partial [Mycobacterium tuberculosis]
GPAAAHPGHRGPAAPVVTEGAAGCCTATAGPAGLVGTEATG